MGLALAISQLGHAQFTWPAAEDHAHKADLYHEDPFITQYRQKIFAVFRGDFKTFEKAYAEIREMVKKDPKDARALVWQGNGETVEAGLSLAKGNAARAKELLRQSLLDLNAAVSLKPTDPNIYMMRAATLYIQGQYIPSKWLPKSVWETLAFDCNNFIQFLGPRISGVSVHVRGETYGELGMAYWHLGELKKAKACFETVAKMNPGTDYEEKADLRLKELASGTTPFPSAGGPKGDPSKS